MEPLSVDDFPRAVADLLNKNEKVSLVLEKDFQSGEVRVGVRRVCSDRAFQLLKESQEEVKQRNQKGYTREQAFNEFEAAQKVVADQIKE